MMNPDTKKKWVAALRSGEYNQGRYALEENGCNCCLGVLARTVGLKTEVGHFATSVTFMIDGMRHTAYLPTGFEGLSNKDIEILTDMNDTESKTFPEIAAYIEENM